MTGEMFFKKQAQLMKENPPCKDMLEKLKRIGVEPGKGFDPSKLDPAIEPNASPPLGCRWKHCPERCTVPDE